MLLTQCPECETAFRLTLDDLGQANGQVQCGHCRKIFNAIEHGTEEDQQDVGLLPGEKSVVLNTDQMGGTGLTDKAAVGSRQDGGEPDTGKNKPVKLPRRLAVGFNRKNTRWATGLLTMFLLVQLAMIFSETLLSNRIIRSVLAGACQIMPCEIPVFVDLDALIIEQSAMISLDLAQHRLLTARLRNGGGIEQPLPGLRLELVDDHGVQVARRVFLPHEYLQTEPELGVIGAGASLQISLHVSLQGIMEELQPSVIGYRLQLMPPT